MCGATAALSRCRPALALGILCGFAAPAVAGAEAGGAAPAAEVAQTDPAAANPRIFDIPAQPLTEALRRYASLSRQPTLFQSELVDGRISSPVHGLYTPDAALRLLLQGTGLAVEKVDPTPGAAFILKAGPAPAPAAVVARADLGDLAGDAAYPTVVQTAVWKALCAHAGTAPGTYRSLLRFQVDADGHIQNARLLGSTGNASRDAAVAATLDDVRLNRSPPLAMPQPVTLLILPRNLDHPAAGQDCDTGAPTP